MDRRYRMIRVGTGDWLCPSNDQSLLWRFHTFEDGAAHGLVDVGYESRTFWRALYMPMPLRRGVPSVCLDDLPDRWGAPWVESDWYLPSRAACIEKMLAHTEAPISR